MEEELMKILENCNNNLIDAETAQVQVLDLFGVIGRLSFNEIEMLVQLKHYDDSDYGNDEKRCAELVEATRNKVGYTKEDVKAYL